MKYVFWVLLVLGSFVLGRVMYEPLAPALVGDRDSAGSQRPGEKEVVVQGPGGRMTVIVKLAEITDAELPERVTLKKRVKVSAEGQDPIFLEAGAKVLVKSREGNTLTIAAMAGPLEGIAALTATDLVEQVAKARVMQMAGVPVAQNDPPQPGPGTRPPGRTPPQGGPPAVAQVDPPKPPPVEPEPEPEPDPEPEPEAPKTLDADGLVAAMQKSVKDGEIKEFTFPQVEGWKAGADENIDGETYQTGLAAYKAETIFGVKTVQAKALIQNGKVQKWVYAKTGMEIK
ncbi:MAG: hypothetical protein HKO57_10425 [Akkermansiaceae bacterium]|nr:hypothetical protein [Akkermansiaceae bacterium]